MKAESPSKNYWLKSESLFDSTVLEVVCEMFGGKILFHRNSNWKVELTVEAAQFINDRYHWGLESEEDVAKRLRPTGYSRASLVTKD